MRALIVATIALAGLAAAAGGASSATTCLASWYDQGTRTASGERFRPDGLTAAHRSIAFGQMVGVRAGNHKITVRVNDRGPAAWTGRCIDLSRGAARALGILGRGVARVSIERP